METGLEDFVEITALILITAGVIATAFYVERIYRILKRDNN
jgi:hypothetical protein